MIYNGVEYAGIVVKTNCDLIHSGDLLPQGSIISNLSLQEANEIASKGLGFILNTEAALAENNGYARLPKPHEIP